MKKLKLEPVPVIIVDTREQKPFTLDGYVTERGTLASGDYSLAGHTNRVAVERKSHADIWACCAGERARFERCLARLAAMDRAAVVIECSLTDLAVRPAQVQRVTPATVVGSCISWAVQYRLPFFWCDTRRYAERVTIRFLLSYLKHCTSQAVLPEVTDGVATVDRLKGGNSLSS